LAFINKKLYLIAVIKRSGEKFTLSENELDTYFQTKSGKAINKEEIKKTMRGSAYTKTAYAYIFRKQVKDGNV